jgi:hypothetical protein
VATTTSHRAGGKCQKSRLSRTYEPWRRFRAFATYVIYAYIGVSTLKIFQVFGVMAGQLNYEDVGNLDAPSIVGLVVGLLNWFLQFASPIPIAMWIYRAHANLAVMKCRDLKYSPGWAVGWYFIPIANLIEPFRAMRELWHRSHSLEPGTVRDAPEMAPWWGTFIAANTLSFITTFSSTRDRQELHGLLSLTLCIASAWRLLQIINKVTQAQSDLLSARHTFA